MTIVQESAHDRTVRPLVFAPIAFGTALFLSSALLFVVQPIVGRMLLPLLGGAPVVWNTAIVFFQGVLLLGYLYAHASSRWLSPRLQICVHVTLVMLVALGLPIALPDGWTPPAEGNQILWLLGVLALTAGAPFFVCAASAPLFQNWFSKSNHHRASDPYFLYSPSNLGGLTALLAFPFLIEPMLKVPEQTSVWAISYAFLCTLTIICAWFVWTAAIESAGSTKVQRSTDGNASDSADGRQGEWGERLLWLALAFVPASLLLAVTNFITTDIAAFPLLWILPLALYLITFALVFARRQFVPHNAMVWTQPFLVIALALWFFERPPLSLSIVLLLHLGAFFIISMVCHGRLAGTRPPASRLTEFYFVLSLGGFLGGAFTAFLTPVMFDSVLEYPLLIALACLLMPMRPILSKTSTLARRLLSWRILTSVAMVLLLTWLFQFDRALFAGMTIEHWGTLILSSLSFAAIFLVLLVCARQPMVYAAALAPLLLYPAIERSLSGEIIHQSRSYFGVYQVRAEGPHHVLYHGTTVHGAQYTDQERKREPTSYYYIGSPISEVIEGFRSTGNLRQVGAVGLGAGAISCHGLPDEQWTFFEIDPAVLSIARDTNYFSLLRDCPPDIRVVLGTLD